MEGGGGGGKAGRQHTKWPSGHHQKEKIILGKLNH